MNLQEKMNLADDVNEDSSSGEEEGNNAVNISPVKQEKEMSYLKNPQSLDESIRSSISSQSKMHLMSPSGSEPFITPSNNLPEDQEIVEEEEEEEE